MDVSIKTKHTIAELRLMVERRQFLRQFSFGFIYNPKQLARVIEFPTLVRRQMENPGVDYTAYKNALRGVFYKDYLIGLFHSKQICVAQNCGLLTQEAEDTVARSYKMYKNSGVTDAELAKLIERKPSKARRNNSITLR